MGERIFEVAAYDSLGETGVLEEAGDSLSNWLAAVREHLEEQGECGSVIWCFYVSLFVNSTHNQ